MNADEARQLLALARETSNDKLQKQCEKFLCNPLYTFTPRPDRPEQLDCQASFLNDEFTGLAVALGGNSAGKSVTGAVKFARKILNTPPPRRNAAAWVVSQSFSQACGVCWDEKLSQFITPEYIAKVDWHNKAKNMPRAVVLKPHRNGKNWVIHFQSADQERKRIQGHSVALAWIDEQVKYSIIMEVWTRLRDYNYPGSFFYTLTPLEPDPELEKIYNEKEKHPDWKFYRLNSTLNTAIAEGFMERLVASEIDQRKETRLTGAFASFAGQIYPTFNDTHLIEPFEIPNHWFKLRAIDFGFSHPTCCLWIARDPADRYVVYKEYYSKERYLHEHAEAIKSEPWDMLSPYTGPTYADYAAAQEMSEFARMEIPCISAYKDVNTGIACVQRQLATGKLAIFNNCENLIREMRSYRWHPNGDKPLKEHDDMVDTLRYAVASDYKTFCPDWDLIAQPSTARIFV